MTTFMPHWLSKQAALSPNRVALELENGDLHTFSTLKQASQRVARQLASLGIKKGMHVAILTPNKIETVYVIHALSYLGAVAVMLNTRLTKIELENQLAISKARLLITTATLQADKKLDFPNQMTDTALDTVPEKQTALLTEIEMTAPFTMMFTSGTTGVPKAVLHTYNNHWWSAMGSVLNIGLEESDKWLLTLPIFHIGGFSILMRSVIYGMSVYFMEKYDRAKLYRALTTKQVTIASLVTLMLDDFVEQLGTADFPEQCRTILLGGGSVPEGLLQRVAEKKIPLFQSYGMTETSSQIVTLSKEYAFQKLGSAGKPLFPAQVKIIDQDAQGVGEILVKGPMVMEGYFANEQANQAVFIDDWLKTGDIGYVDQEGFLYVIDRRTDLIISGGENIYPSEIESVMEQLTGVKNVVVVAKEDRKWGQVPVAFIVKDKPLSATTVQAFLTDKMASYKIPQAIYFIDTLPRNASNKILRRELVKQVNSEN